MNYEGRYGKYYEISDAFKKIAFDKDGNKMMKVADGLGEVRIPAGESPDQTINIIKSEIDTIHKNVGAKHKYRIEQNEKKIIVYIWDPVLRMFSKSRIYKNEARRIHEEQDPLQIDTLEDLLRLKLDPEVLVNINIKTKEGKIIQLVGGLSVQEVLDAFSDLPQLFNAEMMTYFDDCGSIDKVNVYIKYFSSYRKIMERENMII